jgi:trans-aconitate methyltransferase
MLRACAPCGSRLPPLGRTVAFVLPKPRHLAGDYAAQFEDPSVARAYNARPPYPSAVFDLIESLAIGRPRRLLELGAGTGDLTFPLSRRVESIDAVEPSQAMLEIAGSREHAPNIRWFRSTAEAHAYEGPYSAVVAAESLHWMSWGQVLPAIARSLSPSGCLVIVCDRMLAGLAWRDRERELIARYSTNRDYMPYVLENELTTRGLFEETGRRECCEPRFVQSVDDYVESFHSRNGFSRERMGAGADEFDRELHGLVLAHCPDGRVEAKVVTTVIWGRAMG